MDAAAAAPATAVMVTGPPPVHHQRTRTVQLSRSRIGFGFTINGQSPCMLSCIVPGSPADLAALRPGDALLGVNGVSVRGLAHDDVAAAIARCGSLLTLLLVPATQAPTPQQQPPPPPPPPRLATADPRIIGPEVRYEQVPRHRHQHLQQEQQKQRRSKHRRRIICRHKFVLSYIGSLSIPPSLPASGSIPPSVRTVASAVARLKSEARAVSLATLDIDEELPDGNSHDDDLDDNDDNGDDKVSIVLTSCTGRCLLRLCSSGSRSQRLLLLAGRHAQDAAYFGLLAGSTDGSGLTVHGFYANPQLAASHSAHTQWAAAFGIVCAATDGSIACCRSFPPDSGPVLTALRPLSAWRGASGSGGGGGGARRQSASSSSLTTTAVATGTANTFKVPMPPPPPPPPQPPSQSPSLLRRFARGASGSFKRLRRRSVAMSTESLTSSASELEADGANSAAAPSVHPASAADPSSKQNTSGRHLLNTSLASSERNLSAIGAEPEPESASNVAKWATGLRNLLADPAGVRVFTDFLRLEFSEENIQFWLAVEEYRQLTDPGEIRSAADRIASNYVGPSAPFSVNIDSGTVDAIQTSLSQPPVTLFDPAQQHIFNLMRMDSYARFLKSQLYKDCLLCELQSRPLPSSDGGDAGGGGSQAQQQQQQQPQQSQPNLATTRSVGLLSNTDRERSRDKLQQRSGRGFLASLMRGRSSKRYSKVLAANGNPPAADNKVDLLVGFRPTKLPPPPKHHQRRLQQRSGSTGAPPASVWLAVRASPGQPMRDALGPACSKYGMAVGDSWAAVPIQSASAGPGGGPPTSLTSAALPWDTRRLTRADHRRQFALVPAQDLLADPSNSGLSLLLQNCQWSLERMVAAINSGLVSFDTDGVCELQTPSSTSISAGSVTSAIPVTSSPRRPASAVPWQSSTLSSLRKSPASAAAAATAASAGVANVNKDDSLVELLARVQGSRMDDQRGRIDSRNLELPAFLRVGAAAASASNNAASSSNGKENNSPHRPLRGRQLLRSSPTAKATTDAVIGDKLNLQFNNDDARSSTPSPTTHVLLLASPGASSIVENGAVDCHCGYEYRADRV